MYLIISLIQTERPSFIFISPGSITNIFNINLKHFLIKVVVAFTAFQVGDFKSKKVKNT